ncbi:MAG: hypothetical protein CL661_09990 [Bacteroidetes bacterium]|nr:hypothetical protein [Bacteroidota bacterium]
MRIILFLFILSVVGLSGQTTVDNINLPSSNGGGGSFIGSIIEANTKIFAYSADGISIYNSSGTFQEKIYFTETMGKFNPVYFNGWLYVPDQSIMVYNDEPGNQYVYALTPKLKLLVINTVATGNPATHQYWLTSLSTIVGGGEAFLDNEFDSQDGRVILRYDNDANTVNPADRHHRLYVLVNGRDKDPNNNQTGNFHEKRTIFGIYDIDYSIAPELSGHTSLFYTEKNIPTDDYGAQINNYVFNEENNYFYLIRLGLRDDNAQPDPISTALIDIKNITPGEVEHVTTIQFENDGGVGWFKMGKVLYVNKPGVPGDPAVHKIIVLPYKSFSGVVNNPRFCVIDGTTDDVKFFDCPSSMITDAVFLRSHNDLVLTYGPNNAEILEASPPLPNDAYYNTNTFVLHYNSDDNFVLGSNYFDNDNSISTSDYDTNTAIHLTKFDESTAIISKKDGIALLKHNGSDYAYSLLHGGESNFFGKGAVIENKAFINNTVKNGIEILIESNGSPVYSETEKTAYPAYHICANNDGSKMVFFNKLNSYNTGIYIYINSSGATFHYDISTPIGDIIYNPFQDHFLISKFEHNNAEIIAIKASDYTTAHTISISNEQFVKEMFITPTGKLYITSGMQYNTNPKIHFIDAALPDYPIQETELLTGFDTYSEPFLSYFASFDYNTYDETTYATITIQEQKLPPYNTEPNSIFTIVDESPIPPPSKIIALTDDITNEINIDDYTYKTVCPGNFGADYNSQYYGKVFIVGYHLYAYNYLNPPSSQSGLLTDESYFIDIVYSKKHDQLFGVKETNDLSLEHRKFEIWKINIDGMGNIQTELVNPTNLPAIDGQIACMFANPYDGKIYIHRKVDAAKLGDGQAALYAFDPDNPVWEITDLGMATYFPDYDHTVDIAMFFFNNRTTPYINPYTNHIYIPNGGHSCVSKVGFTPNEALLLNDGEWAWLSFPRMNRDGDDAVPVNTVLLNNIEPDGYLDESELENLPPESWVIEDNIYDGTQWQLTGDLINIQSTLGYKLKLLYGTTPENKWVHLLGNVLDPAEDVNIYENYDNWVGYWLYESQSPFDAIPENVLDELTIIKAQTWCCVKDWDYPDGYAVPYWICAVHEDDVSMDYGDMVILETNSDMSFQWQSTGNPSSIIDKDATEYYQFTEQSDYTSFFIELDTTEYPQEIGAFIEDSCVGASTVLAGDTIVLIPGYTEGISGDVVFEEYYGSQKSANPEIDEYLVRNKNTGTWRKRTINTREKQDYYFISFKSGREKEENNNEQLFNIFPNPVNKTLNINYNVERTALVNIGVYDSYGRHITALFSSTQPEGLYGIQWNLAGNNGKKLPKGLYIIKLKIDNVVMSRKVVVN